MGSGSSWKTIIGSLTRVASADYSRERERSGAPPLRSSSRQHLPRRRPLPYLPQEPHPRQDAQLQPRRLSRDATLRSELTAVHGTLFLSDSQRGLLPLAPPRPWPCQD